MVCVDLCSLLSQIELFLGVGALIGYSKGTVQLSSALTCGWRGEGYAYLLCYRSIILSADEMFGM